MPWTSAVRAAGSTLITPVRPETSRPGRSISDRGRNRFELRFASRTGSPCGMRWYDDRSRPTA
jgi:hypothetical protein